MKQEVNLKNVYVQSGDVVAREVSGEFIIIPITSGMGDTEDAIFSLNECAQAVWKKLSSGKKLKDIALALSKEFDAPLERIERDCTGLIRELLKRKMVVIKK